MQFSPHQLKERLLRGLDDENNVVDMAAVLQVVSLLESCPITREALEQTRIGRLVNELRKKTTNNDLAKRAKRLVRSWQKLISSHSESCSVNGDGAHHPPLYGSKSCSPASSVLHGANRSVVNISSKSSLSAAKTTKSTISPTGDVSKSNNTPTLANDKGMTRSSSYASKPASSYRNQVCGVDSSKTNAGRPLTPSSRPLTPSGRPLTPLTPSSRPRTPALNSLSSCSNKPLTPTGVSSRPLTPSTKPSTPLGRSLTPSSRPSTPSSRPATPTIGQAKYQNNGTCSASNTSRSDSEKNHYDNNKGTFSSRDTNSCYNDKQSEQKVTRLSNHSPELPISKDVNSNSNNSRNALSKTNVANRKRTRQDNLGPQPAKKPTTPKDLKNASMTYTSDSINNGQLSTKSSFGDSLKNNVSSSRASWLDNVEPYPLDDKLSLFTKKGLMSFDAKDKPFLKTPKVKTTAQLIAELQATSGSSSVGSNIMQKINKNQIDKEYDILNEPVVPFDALPRSRQKSLMNSQRDTPKQSGKRMSRLSKTKTELVEKFLESSVHASVFSPLKLEAAESPDIFDTSGSTHSANMSINTEKSKEKVFTPIPKRKSPTAELDEIYRMLPPLNVDEIVWDEDDTECYTIPKPSDGTETNVDRVQSQQWNGVNGCFDTNNSWHDWTQTISYSSYEEDSLHVLPYVNIDS